MATGKAGNPPMRPAASSCRPFHFANSCATKMPLSHQKQCRGTMPQNFQAQPLGVAKSNSSHYRISRVLQELETLYVGEAAPYPTQVAGVRFHGGHALIQFEDIATRTVGRTSQLLASRHPADGERSKRVDSPEKRSAASVVSVALFDVLQGNAPSLIPPHRDGASSVPGRRAA